LNFDGVCQAEIEIIRNIIYKSQDVATTETQNLFCFKVDEELLNNNGRRRLLHGEKPARKDVCVGAQEEEEASFASEEIDPNDQEPEENLQLESASPVVSLNPSSHNTRTYYTHPQIVSAVPHVSTAHGQNTMPAQVRFF